MAKFKIDLNDLHMFEWGDLWWFDYEIQICLRALNDLVINQEEIFSIKKASFNKNRKEKLSEIPHEFKDSFEQHFYADGDRIFAELIQIQRNSACLSYFSFLENKLIELLKMMNETFGMEIEIPKNNILPTLKVIIEKDFGVDSKTFDKQYSRIINQVQIRNAIAHRGSYLEHKKYFPNAVGIELNGLKVVISDPIYLRFLIKEAEELFKELLIVTDKTLTRLKTKS